MAARASTGSQKSQKRSPRTDQHVPIGKDQHSIYVSNHQQKKWNIRMRPHTSCIISYSLADLSLSLLSLYSLSLPPSLPPPPSLCHATCAPKAFTTKREASWLTYHTHNMYQGKSGQATTWWGWCGLSWGDLLAVWLRRCHVTEQAVCLNSRGRLKKLQMLWGKATASAKTKRNGGMV